ncbi:hypothetical protein GY12_08860 [Micrococcus luteus]|nr:hypothetical protein GY12_08860 [Micrococcus luteus]
MFATLYAAIRTDMLDSPFMRDFLLTAKDTLLRQSRRRQRGALSLAWPNISGSFEPVQKLRPGTGLLHKPRRHRITL